MDTVNIYQVGNEDYEFILATTSSEAIEDHLDRIGDWDDWYNSKEDVQCFKIDLEQKGKFEVENGYQESTWKEFFKDEIENFQLNYTGAKMLAFRE